MKFHVLTLFPEMFPPVLGASILGRAERSGILSFHYVNIRDYSADKRRRVDDTPFGGGKGMLMQAQPVFDALRSVDAESKRILYMSPRGRKLDPALVRSLAEAEELVILCGHYEGIDQRILDHWPIEEVSIGDYVLTGGETAAMVLIDSVSRLLPGVLSKEGAAVEESVYSGLLEYPQYTQPREYEGMAVPEVLVSGNHRLIHLWKFEESLKLTKRERPDLFDEFVKNHRGLDKDEQKVMEKVIEMM